MDGASSACYSCADVPVCVPASEARHSQLRKSQDKSDPNSQRARRKKWNPPQATAETPGRAPRNKEQSARPTNPRTSEQSTRGRATAAPLAPRVAQHKAGHQTPHLGVALGRHQPAAAHHRQPAARKRQIDAQRMNVLYWCGRVSQQRRGSFTSTAGKGIVVVCSSEATASYTRWPATSLAPRLPLAGAAFLRSKCPTSCGMVCPSTWSMGSTVDGASQRRMACTRCMCNTRAGRQCTSACTDQTALL